MNNTEKLALVAKKVARCTACDLLVECRTQTVFHDGNPNADTVFVGEAPGRDEDEQGIPFVGRAGKLLDEIIEACGWDRQKDVYICNILKCRPPHNRDPLPQEALNCLKYLKLQFKVIRPKFIVCLGKVASMYLLKDKSPIGHLRGRWHRYEDGDLKANLICTYHPSYLLRNQKAYQSVWDDLAPLRKFKQNAAGNTS